MSELTTLNQHESKSRNILKRGIKAALGSLAIIAGFNFLGAGEIEWGGAEIIAPDTEFTLGTVSLVAGTLAVSSAFGKK